MNKTQQKLITDCIESSAFHMQALHEVRELNLPDWAIGAGFVRNCVWDNLHNFDHDTPLNDVDVLFFYPFNTSSDYESSIEHKLSSASPTIQWSVRNQARMHIRNNDAPYTSTQDAMLYWLEKPTCVAVRLEDDGSIDILAPHGLDDLVSMRVSPTPAGKSKIDQYTKRLYDKNWLATWPKLRIVEE